MDERPPAPDSPPPDIVRPATGHGQPGTPGTDRHGVPGATTPGTDRHGKPGTDRHGKDALVRPHAPTPQVGGGRPPTPPERGPSQRLFGPFELLQELGRGGMGAVYRARDREGREVALKVLVGGFEAAGAKLERFRREAIISHALEHPGIVRAVNAGMAAGRPWVAFELVEGARTFQEVLREVPVRRRAELVRDAARALGHAHRRNVVHRDVKPPNLLVDAAGRVRVTDFGLAAARGFEPLTQTGSLVGTPLYMSPEQAAGKKEGVEVGPPSDVWGLGVILYEALTGELPFLAPTFMQLVDVIKKAAPKAPRAAAPGVDPALEAVCLRALQRDPARRYPDGEAMAADLDQALAALDSGLARSDATPPDVSASTSGEVPSPRRRRRLALLATHLTLAAVTLIVLSGVLLARRERSPERLLARAVEQEQAGALALARATYERAAAAGAPGAVVALARLLEEGRGGERDLAAARRWWRVGAEAGHAAAVSGLARRLLADGEAAEARPWLERAAELGDRVAMRELGRLLEAQGDRAGAERLHRRAAEAGDAPAMRALAALLEREGPREAIEWARRAAGTGEPAAMRALGERLLSSPALALDPGEAERWLVRAAEAGDGRAMGALAARLLEAPERRADGRAWLARAARAHDAPSLRRTGEQLIAERRYEAALPPLLWAVALGDGGAADQLGALFREGRGVPRDDRRARLWFQRAAELGDASGTAHLGALMSEGLGGPRDPAQALALFRRAAEAGSLEGTYRLARALERGEGAPRDRARAVELLTQAAERGHPRSMVRLAELLEADAGGRADPIARATALYRRAAELGDAVAMNSYGHALTTGAGVARDEAQAAEWFRRGAEAGDGLAMLNLGLFLRDGRGGVPRDVEAAARWLQRSADAGQESARRALAELQGTAARGAGAADLAADLRARAERGEPEAMTALGAALRAQGDAAEAERWLRRASEAGHLGGVHELARLLQEVTGERAPAAQREAVELLRRGVERGHGPCMNDLGRLMFAGQALPRDLPQAAALFRRAAEAGVTAGMKNLAIMLREGLGGLERDDEEAVAWLRKAAERGMVDAWVVLGQHAEQGRGVPLDRAEAARLYRLAADRQNAEGMAALGRLLLEGDAGGWVEGAGLLFAASRKGELDANVPLARALLKGRGTVRRPAAAVRYLTEASQKGRVDAAIALIRLFDVVGRQAEARRMAQGLAADHGQPRAMVELSRLLARGRGGPADAGAAAEWLAKAAEKGAPEAFAAQARALEAGEAGDRARAADLWRRAAEAGHVPGMVEHARRLRETDAGAARVWFERAARAGDAEAALWLATGP